MSTPAWPRGRRVVAALATGWRRIPAPWRRAILITLVLRIGLSVFAATVAGTLPGLDPVPVAGLPGTDFSGYPAQPPSEQGTGLLGAAFERYDALWYLAIAEHGYPPLVAGGVPQAAAFFPAFPGIVAVVDVLPGGALLAGSLVSLVATVVALAGLYRLAEEMGAGPAAARRTQLLAAVFPTAMFLLAPYTEAMFLAVSTWVLVLALRRSWAPAAAGALVAALTRNVGVLLALPLALEGVRAWRRGEGDSHLLHGTAAALAAPAGTALFMAFGWWRWGTPLASVSVQAGWQRELTPPWESALRAVEFGTGSLGDYATGYHSMDLVIVGVAAAAVVALLRRRTWPLGVYGMAHVLVWLILPFPGRPLLSATRFALVLAPAFVVMARWTARPAVERTWLAASAAFLGVNTLLFVDWYYVF